MAGDVEEVLEVLVSGAQQGPHRAGALIDVLGLPLAGVVAQKGAIETGVGVLHQLDLNRTKIRRVRSGCFKNSSAVYQSQQMNRNNVVQR